MATSVLKAATSTPNIPVAATISEVDRAVLERMSKGGSPENLDLGSSAESLRLKKILHGRPPSSSSTSFSSDSDESNDSSAKSRVSEENGRFNLKTLM